MGWPLASGTVTIAAPFPLKTSSLWVGRIAPGPTSSLNRYSRFPKVSASW